MDASKNHCDRQLQLLLEKKQRCKVSCAKVLKFVDLLGSLYLFQLLHTLTLKAIVKMWEKSGFLWRRVPNLFEKEGHRYRFLARHIRKVVYILYITHLTSVITQLYKSSTTESTKNIFRTNVRSIMYKNNLFLDLLRSWYLFESLYSSPTAETSKSHCDKYWHFFFEMKEGFKVTCVKTFF